MATLNLRIGKANPLTNQEVDDNFTALNNALGATSSTIPTPTGSGVPVLSISPTISTHLFGGTSANLTRFPNAFGSISSTGSTTTESHNIGLIAEATAHTSTTTTWGIGLYGVGYTSPVTRSVGVSGEAHVSAAADVGVAIGVRGYSTDAHTGALGYNIGLYADASGSTAGNYALWMNTGNIYSAVAQTWSLSGNLTFSGAYTVTVPTLSLSNALVSTSGGTGTATTAVGDLLQGSANNAWSKLTAIATGNVLISGGVGTASTWGKVGLDTHISGTLAVVSGGTGADNALAARTNLGLTIGTNVQAYSAVLVAIAGLANTGIPVKTGTSTMAVRSIVGTTGYITLTDGDGVSGNPTITVGQNVAKLDVYNNFAVTSAVKLPVGTTLQRPATPVTGDMRYNSDLSQYEGYSGSAWGAIGGGATGGGGNTVFFENSQTITTSYTVTTGKSAMSTGPITINAGVTVTVPNGSKWVVL